MPETAAPKMHTRCERSDPISNLRVNQRGLRIDMDIDGPRWNIRLAPLAKLTPRRHESECVIKDLTIGFRDPIHDRCPSTACETLVCDQQMERAAVTARQRLSGIHASGFCRHPHTHEALPSFPRLRLKADLLAHFRWCWSVHYSHRL